MLIRGVVSVRRPEIPCYKLVYEPAEPSTIAPFKDLQIFKDRERAEAEAFTLQRVPDVAFEDLLSNLARR